MDENQREYDLALLRTFLAIAKTGDLTLAAEKLKTSHASVSVGLRSLEEYWGVELFKRTPSGMILTSSGKALLPQAHSILAESNPKTIHKRHSRGSGD
jgi:DNA-binding transcriptional LysR family regulator